jgi:hypothetical protein
MRPRNRPNQGVGVARFLDRAHGVPIVSFDRSKLQKRCEGDEALL